MMPRIANLDGVLIRIHHGDHPPPHLHARYQGDEAKIELRVFRVIDGKLPPVILKAVVFWMRRHQSELLENWERGQKFQTMNAIVETVDD